MATITKMEKVDLMICNTIILAQVNDKSDN